MDDRVAELPLRIEEVSDRRHRIETTGGFTRVSTTVRLSGAAADGTRHTGAGEDVTYDTVDQDRFAALLPDLPLEGTYTLGSFSAFLEEVDLFPTAPERPASRHYRRWALESAALDLALCQAGQSLGDAVDRQYDPVRFVVSPSLTGGTDHDPSTRPVEALRELHPDLGVKLDATAAWDDDLVAALAATGAVAVVDFKGHYDDPAVATSPDAALYRRVRDGFPAAVLEDPAVTPATEEALAGAEDRLSWDAPVTGVEAVAALPVTPRWLNCKPSRFGTVAALLDFLDHCEAAGIRLYGGGQFELDVGRRQIQALASLYYPDGPNDVAPRAYNDPAAEGRPPGSPLPAPDGAPGFGYASESG